jgi:hypothetical protein
MMTSLSVIHTVAKTYQMMHILFTLRISPALKHSTNPIESSDFSLFYVGDIA